MLPGRIGFEGVENIGLPVGGMPFSLSGKPVEGGVMERVKLRRVTQYLLSFGGRKIEPTPVFS